jgi:homoserine dehydrogenase
MKKVRLLLLGFGVIGRGFAKVLAEKSDYIKKKHGVELVVVGVGEYNGCLVGENGVDLKAALDLREKGKWLDQHPQWKKMPTKDMIKSIAADIAVEIVPSDIKTGEPGAGLIEAALAKGLHVVSSDKCALANRFSDLMALARKNGKWLLFEASAGGGMPLMNLVRECIQADEVKSMEGILNGTTNYILTKMSKGGMDLETALREAQELGYAEADPTYDVEGIDAAAKGVILANDIMGMGKKFSDAKIAGIRGITKEAVQLAKKNGYVIKLIVEIKGGSLSVGPKLIPESHPLNIDSNLNAVMFKTDIGKDVVIIGRGAGGRETQSAIFSDILRICKDL